MKCPECQAELPDNAKFCNQCGKSLQAELIRSHCNAAIADFLGTRRVVTDCPYSCAVSEQTLCEYVRVMLPSRGYDYSEVDLAAGVKNSLAMLRKDEVVTVAAEESLTKGPKQGNRSSPAGFFWSLPKGNISLTRKGYRHWLTLASKAAFKDNLTPTDPSGSEFFEFLAECMGEPGSLKGEQGRVDRPLENVIRIMGHIDHDFTLLDFGCGNGRLLFVVAEHNPSLLDKMHYIGIDINEETNRGLVSLLQHEPVFRKLASSTVATPAQYFGARTLEHTVDYVFAVNVLHEIKVSEVPSILVALIERLRYGGNLCIHETSALPVGERDFLCWEIVDFDMLLSGLTGLSFAASSYRTKNKAIPCVDVVLTKAEEWGNPAPVPPAGSQEHYRRERQREPRVLNTTLTLSRILGRTLDRRRLAWEYDLKVIEDSKDTLLVRYYAFLLAQIRNLSLQRQDMRNDGYGFPLCPICLTGLRWDSESDIEGTEFWVFVECPNCGLSNKMG